VAVVIRMKKMGRKHRAFFRICATDKRSPRDGRVIEAIGTYDPSVPETDARCTLDHGRVQHWLSVGALPSDNVKVLIKKYGPNGTHLKEMEEARARLSLPKVLPDPGPPAFVPESPKTDEPAAEAAAAEATAEAPAAEAPAAAVAEVSAEAPAAEPAAEAPAEPAAEAPAEESPAEESKES
jgi:small subunit ribosomal protein S16